MVDRALERSDRDPSPTARDHSVPSTRAKAERRPRAETTEPRGTDRNREDPRGHESKPEPRRGPEPKERELPKTQRHRERTRNGRETCVVSPSERQTLHEIGRFRVVRRDDLALYRYSGRATQLSEDLRNLMRQGLVEKKTVWTGRHREELTFLALTKTGKRFLKRRGEGVPRQAIYAGFVKLKELRHDAAIYPMFQKESARIASEGGHVGRVILDYELKKTAYSPLAKAKALPPDEYAKRQAEIARENGLKIVNGHIALPDLRIEYITRQGLTASVDLELATESYHGSHASEKARAGFTMYAAPETAARLSAALEEREIIAEILSL